MRHPFLRTLAGSATDPNFENVTLLLHGDGTNGGQNNTFVDGSTNNFTITRNGNTTQGTFSPYGDNWSNYFDGAGDRLTVSSTSAFDFSSAPNTFEFWIYPLALPGSGNNCRILLFGTNDNSGSFVVQFGSGGDILFGVPKVGYTALSSSTGTLETHKWQHFAFVQNGSSSSIYKNGASVASGTVTAPTSANNDLKIGYDTVGTVNFNFVGYLSNIRVVKGTAVYTGAFTVPTAPLTAITNTSLLTCQSNRFRDASTNNFTITRNGDVSVQRFSPFSPTAVYAAGTIGGSGYFDGTGDYLTVPSNTALAMGTGDFTVEFWLYIVSRKGGGYIFATGGQANDLFVTFDTNGNFLRLTNQATVFAVTGTLSLATWIHIAVVQSSGSSKIYVDGTGGTAVACTINFTSNAPSIGATSTGTAPINGYISNLRVLKGTAQYTANFTPPTAPLTAITNTSLLLDFTNAAILDNAMMAVLETVGNAQISTTVKKYGTGSLYFDGTDDGLTSPYNPAYSFGTGDFTIEAWVYIAGNSAVDAGGVRTAAIVGSFPTSGTLTNVWVLGISGNSTTTGTGFFFQSFVSGTTYQVSVTTTLSQTTWHHLAVARSGTTTKLFLNGSEVASGTLGNQNVNGAYPIYVGRNIYTGYPNVLNGYIDDLRITKGVARYTANFTAPTAAFPDL